MDPHRLPQGGEFAHSIYAHASRLAADLLGKVRESTKLSGNYIISQKLK